MIRMVLFALGFVAITVTLIIVQPGAERRQAAAPVAEPAVTRAQPVLTQPVPQQPVPSGGISPLGLPAATDIVRPASAPRVTAQSGPVDDQEMRRMTWQTLSSLNQATGRDSAPGQPGSLLHTIVQRSLGDVPATGGAPVPEVYVVQSGDSLVSIAEEIYGDVNMTGPLFAANTSILSRPDDLRAGQTLILPKR